MRLHKHRAEVFLQALILRIFMSFRSFVTIVQKPEPGDQIGEKGILLAVFMVNNNLIEGTRAKMSPGS